MLDNRRRGLEHETRRLPISDLVQAQRTTRNDENRPIVGQADNMVKTTTDVSSEAPLPQAAVVQRFLG
jgi:hypothetical protein